jgi:hypothetical protein
MPVAAMRSQTGSSLVAVLATLALIAGLGAAFVPALLHPGRAPAPSNVATPAQQDAVNAARGAVRALDAQQQRAAAPTP